MSKMSIATVANLMTRDVFTLSPRHHIRRVAEEMRLGRIRHVPIVDRNQKLLGLVTQRDVLAASHDLARPVSEIMQRDIKTVTATTPAFEAAYLLLRYDIGCVPVTDARGTVIGIVTDTDFVRAAYTLLGGRVPVDELEAEEREADNA